MTGALRNLGDGRTAEQRRVDSLGEEVMETVRAGGVDYKVLGDWRDLWSRIYDTEVYADVAAQLAEEGVEIEVHRYREVPHCAEASRYMIDVLSHSPENMINVDVPVLYDRITVMAVGGVAVEREGHPGPNHVAQVYPPEN